MADYISTVHAQCDLHFRDVIGIDWTLTTHITRISQNDIQEEYDRYRIWAINVGAPLAGRDYERSLDYRLRKSDATKSQIFRILRRIDELLLKVLQYLDQGLPPLPAQPHDTTISTVENLDNSEPAGADPDWASSSSETDSSLQRGVSELDAKHPELKARDGHESQPISVFDESRVRCSSDLLYGVLLSLTFAIKCLYKLPVRSAVPLARMNHTDMQSDPIISAYHQFDLLYVQDLYREADKAIVHRLAKALTLRRYLLHYRRKRNEDLKQDKSKSLMAQQMIANRPTQIHQAGVFRPVVYPSGIGSAPPPSSIARTSVKATTFRGMTEVPIIDVLEEARSATDVSSSAGSMMLSDRGWAWPPRPKNAKGEILTDFECPFCCTVVHLRPSIRAWRKHVLSDLEPYQCTYTHCKTPEITYAQKNDWRRHEDTHLTSYRCEHESHGSFLGTDVFLDHMRKMHAMPQSYTPSDEALAVYRVPVDQVDSSPCTICRHSRHQHGSELAHHLERISLFALPRLDGIAEDAESSDIPQEGSTESIERSTSAMSFSSSTNSQIIMRQVEQAPDQSMNEDAGITSADLVPDADIDLIWSTVKPQLGLGEAPMVEKDSSNQLSILSQPMSPRRQFLASLSSAKAKFRGVRLRRGHESIPSSFKVRFIIENFVPWKAIHDYFSDPNTMQSVLEDIFKSQQELQIPDYELQPRYLRLFSILVAIGRGDQIDHFITRLRLNDDSLPITSTPEQILTYSRSEHVLWERFEEVQWRFYAWRFAGYNFDQVLESSRILPIIDWQMLSQGRWSMTFKVWLHPDYHDFTPNSRHMTQQMNNNNIFVVKCLDASSENTRRLYHGKVKDFIALGCARQMSPLGLIKLYASFIQSDIFCIISEFANWASLGHYFRRIQPPRSRTDIHDFWISLITVVSGLASLHQLPQARGSTETHFHGNLKPSKILVFGSGDDSPYQFSARLGDLGYSTVAEQRYRVAALDLAKTNHSSTYGPPTSRVDSEKMNLHQRIIFGQASDVWSMAAILSVAATWVVGGIDMVDRFAHRRQIARENRGLSPADCFHNDDCVLPEVISWHQQLTEATLSPDEIVVKLWNAVLDKAFSEGFYRRQTASHIYSTCRRLIALSQTAGERTDGETKFQPSSPEMLSNKPVYPTLHKLQTPDIEKLPKALAGEKAEPDLKTQNESFMISADQADVGQASNISAGLSSTSTFHNSSKKQIDHDVTLQQQPWSSVNLTYKQAPHVESKAINRDLVNPQWGTTKAGKPRKRLGQACDSCRQRRIKCDPSPPFKCRQCENLGQDCSLEAPLSKGVAIPSSCPRHGSELIPMNHMTVDQLYQWRIAYRKGRSLEIPHGHLASKLQERNHVFLIDNVTSMSPYWRDVVHLFDLLANFIRSRNENPIALYSSSSTELVLNTDVTALITEVEAYGMDLQSSSDFGASNFEISLDHAYGIFEGKKMSTLSSQSRSPLSVFLFTDAVRQRQAYFIDEMLSLREKEHLHVPFSIQIIRFGDILDEEDSFEQQILDHEFIDVEPSTGNVWKMLLGKTVQSRAGAECTCDQSKSVVS